MFEEGSIVLKRISLSKFGGNRILAFKRRLVFDKLYLLADYKTDSDRYGCVRVTIAYLQKKMPLFSAEEIKGAITALIELGFIHRERASKFNNAGYLIKINDYENLTKFYPQANTERRPNVDLTETERRPNVTHGNKSEKEHLKITETERRPNVDLTETESIHNVITNNVITNNNTPITPEVVLDSKPKKTRKKSELPGWVTKLYLSKLAEHFNQTLDKVGTADTKKLTELFKVVSDESRMSQLFAYYFTLQDDFYKKKGYPLAILVKNQTTFFRAMNVTSHTQQKNLRDRGEF